MSDDLKIVLLKNEQENARTAHEANVVQLMVKLATAFMEKGYSEQESQRYAQNMIQEFENRVERGELEHPSQEEMGRMVKRAMQPYQGSGTTQQQESENYCCTCTIL